MPTLEEWAQVDPGSTEAVAVAEIFRQRPHWLTSGNIENGVVCRFASSKPAVEPVVVFWDEITLYWGPYHDHVLWASSERPLEAANDLIDFVDRIMCGDMVRLVAYDRSDRWLGSTVLAPSEATLDYALRRLSQDAERIEVVSWPEGVLPAPDPSQ